MFKVNVYYIISIVIKYFLSNSCTIHSMVHNGHVLEVEKQTQISEVPVIFPVAAFIYLVN